MRTQENVKSNYVTKATSTTKVGPTIMMPIKKIYCAKCQRLIKGQIKGSRNTSQIICPRCNQILWSWKSISWRSAIRVG
jgi:RNase P subunit RPR2